MKIGKMYNIIYYNKITFNSFSILKMFKIHSPLKKHNSTYVPSYPDSLLRSSSTSKDSRRPENSRRCSRAQENGSSYPDFLVSILFYILNIIVSN
jgi:hypothetical protein